MYRGSRNGLVFSAGMITWSSALVAGGTHDYKVKQATVNLLADMGVPSPSSFEDPTQTNLKLATASTDTTPPTTTLQVSSVPIQGTNNSTWTFEGTASDNVGGKVGGVEISYDGGATWKRAVSGTPTRFLDWEYSVVLPSTPTPFVLTRAIDDSFNMEAVKAVHDGGTTLYVYGGSADNTIFIEKSVVTGGAFTFTVKNNTNTIGTFESTSATVNNIVVQLAIGQNSITLSDLNFPASGGNATLPRFADHWRRHRQGHHHFWIGSRSTAACSSRATLARTESI
jgi:hypothetical protein